MSTRHERVGLPYSGVLWRESTAVSVALKARFVMSLYVPKKSPVKEKIGLLSREDF